MRTILIVPVLISLAITRAASNRGIDLAGLNQSVAPGEDFFEYANGAWLKSTEIPPDKSSFGTFTILADHTRTNLATLIKETAGGKSASSVAQKVGDYYSAYMDETGIESKGAAPLQPRLSSIDAIKDRRDLARAIGANLRADVDPLNNTQFQTENLFGVWISQGLRDPRRHYPYLLQGGLGMPDRDYYTSPSEKMAALRAHYQQHIEAMLRLAGIGDAAARASRIFALEIKMAEIHATRVESADANLATTWTHNELFEKAPGLDWPTLLEAAGLKDARAFYIWHPHAIIGLSKLSESESLDTWKDWLTFHAIEQAAAFLPRRFGDERFNFAGKALTGALEQRPRSQRAVDSTSAALPDSVGKLYVARYFSAESKIKALALVKDLEKAFAKRIDKLAWMSPETKTRAKEKLRTLRVGVGYPDRWRDESGIIIRKDDPLGNAQRAELCALSPRTFQTSQTGEPQRMVDRAANRQRAEPSAAKRARFSGRDSAAAVLQSRRGRRAQLRSDRRGHRPRDQPQL